MNTHSTTRRGALLGALLSLTALPLALRGAPPATKPKWRRVLPDEITEENDVIASDSPDRMAQALLDGAPGLHGKFRTLRGEYWNIGRKAGQLCTGDAAIWRKIRP
jgi:hypothetical protein